MDYTVVADENEMAKAAAGQIAQVIRDKQARNEKAVIGLATGSTPIKVYEELVRIHKQEGLSFKNVITFNLDEYVVSENDDRYFYSKPESYHGFMHEHLFKHVDIEPKNRHLPDGMARDLATECKNYEEEIKRVGGIDLLLVGIGPNGHIGFNEPGSPMDGRTSVVELTPETIKINQAKFNFAAKQAITMGLGTIMDAKAILLIATGDSKKKVLSDAAHAVQIPPRAGWNPRQYREAINASVQGNPATLLNYHRNCKAIVSKDAGENMFLQLSKSPPDFLAKR